MKENSGYPSYYCPLYGRDIASGKCLDINYERRGYMNAGCLDEIAKHTGKREPHVSETCEACPNCPPDIEVVDENR